MIPLYAEPPSFLLYWFMARIDVICVVTSGSMPGMSLCDHAKQSWFSWTKIINLRQTMSSINEPMLTSRSGLVRSIWISFNCQVVHCLTFPPWLLITINDHFSSSSWNEGSMFRQLPSFFLSLVLLSSWKIWFSNGRWSVLPSWCGSMAYQG